MILSELQKRELTKLIDKHENRKDYGKNEKSNRRTFLHITEKNYPNYYHVSDSSFRLDYNSDMEKLSRLGFLELIWKNFQKGEYLEKIALQEDNLDEIYKTLDRKPKIELFKELMDILQNYYQTAPQQLKNFYLDMIERLEKLDKLPSQVMCHTPFEVEELLLGLHHLTKGNDHEIPKRQFSVEIYGDSKKWDKYENKIIWILKHYWPRLKELSHEGELLSEFGLIDNPKHVNISGSGQLKFETPLGEVSLTKFYPDVGLSPQMIQDMEVKMLEAEVIVTIENLTSYYHYISIAPSNHLVIYLGGYHNRMRRTILTKLWKFVNTNNLPTTFYHWGDLDLGGFRIFIHLLENTNIPFYPLMMDEKTYLTHLDGGHKFDNNYHKKLSDLLDDDRYNQFHGIIKSMLKHNIRIEQEAISNIQLPG